ncbi:MAG: Ldh family oxidoreductase [Candidatus Devosia symbiotica]|nr:Ldh family oxidoreductase [Candidatus Devosia symbiotica]
MALISVKDCTHAAQATLKMVDVGAEAAKLQVDLLLDAKLRGVSSHGFLRLERIIVRINSIPLS